MTAVLSRPPSDRRAGSARLGALLVAPTVLVLAVVVAYPTVQAVWQSLYGARGIDPESGFVDDTEPFVGLDNYAVLFTSAGDRFWNALANTVFLTGTSVALEIVLGVGMALIMHQALRGRGLVRAGILIPWAIPTAIVALLWRWIFNADGLANAILPGQVLWTSEGLHAKLAVVFADVWKTAPFVGLLVLAGLQVIPKEVDEAARVDGAGSWRRLRSITLPLVKPALLVAVLFRVLDALRMFDMPYVLIGARKESVETLSMLAHDEASNVRFGPGAAYAVILFVFVFLVAFAFVKLLGADVVGDAGKGVRSRKTRRAKVIA
ncbi:carbohydrate ABC transporter permease [Actinokineospora iranica]|uniref:Carbohydrate ABC transporter membrane protein 1, CUT1 family n=1 Tax=Actinokineospora iranica TaxID=1271860 RepID=A0A1G6SBI2_9PSEU|nr:sugar ABC transporter permease [Actinokineospora iranica]SDD13566.1 carbohydrate ABC transporter membrane protein 1, CUT1 family [Actinokineospora iranica]